VSAVKAPCGFAGGLAWVCRFGESVRVKLLALALGPLLLGAPALLVIVWLWGAHGYEQLLVNKVSSDLAAARQHFERSQSQTRAGLEGFAASHRLATALARGDSREINRALNDAADGLGLDFLLLVDPLGRVRAAAGEGSAAAVVGSGGRMRWAATHEALQGYAAHGLEVFSAAELRMVDEKLAARARLPLRPTRNAAPDDRMTEDRGLVIHLAAPAPSAALDDGRPAAPWALEAGVLLNGAQGVVDRIDAVVYRDASLPLGSRGTATLFLGDARIATNVPSPGGEGGRALGTRVSKAVADKVLGRGEVWLGSAFVVSDTYFSAYEALTDSAGARVGMLYVGFLEAPLKQALYLAMAGLFLLYLAVSGAFALVALRWARTVFRPLERMSGVIERIEAGDEAARVGAVPSRDELGRLARAFDRLLDSLSARRWELQRWGRELDRKVAERTAALEAANESLRSTQQQLVMREKLAAIGELTAGVAHEINNPITVIQGNLDVLREVLGSAAEPAEEELRLIDRQTERIQAIVAKLLRFARPGDFAGSAEPVDVNAAVNDCVVLTRHNIRRSSVLLETKLQARTAVEITPGELQQVLINLIVNAVQAMPDGGRLTLATRDLRADEDGFDGAAVLARDDGCGIAAADLDRIFNPFFTTKKQHGTGLGLAIAYAIVRRYGGDITVDSAPGEGAVFTVRLRRQAVYEEGTGRQASASEPDPG
jgi:two-component system, NtrC family, sensor kinase